jgi:hypothetical protein
VRTTSGETAAGDDEAGASALNPRHGPPQKRRKTVLTVSAALVPGYSGGAAASGTYRAIATAVGVPKSQRCTAAAAAPLLELEGASEQQRARSPVHAPLPASVMVHAFAEMEHPIAVGRAQTHLSIAEPGTATEDQFRAYTDAQKRSGRHLTSPTPELITRALRGQED